MNVRRKALSAPVASLALALSLATLAFVNTFRADIVEKK